LHQEVLENLLCSFEKAHANHDENIKHLRAGPLYLEEIFFSSQALLV